MARGAAARRYAKALFQLASAAGQAEGVRAELDLFHELLDERPELAEVLLQPLHTAEQRHGVLALLADRMGAGPLLRNFYQVLIAHRRLVDLDAIRDEYARLTDEMAGIRRASVRTVRPLTEAQTERLRQVLAARLGQQVELDVTLDPALIGGHVVQVGDLVFDGSLRTQLRQLRSTLGSGP